MTAGATPRGTREARVVAMGGLGALAVAGALQLGLGLDPLAALGGLGLCPLRALSGWPCPGCGMTRAFLSLARLDVAAALAAHPAAPALLGLVLWRAVRPLPEVLTRAPAVATALALVLVSWGLRLLDARPL